MTGSYLPSICTTAAATILRTFVAIAALKALADQGEGKTKTVADAIKKYGIDPEKADPTTV